MVKIRSFPLYLHSNPRRMRKRKQRARDLLKKNHNQTVCHLFHSCPIDYNLVSQLHKDIRESGSESLAIVAS